MPLYVYACDFCEIEVEELRPAERADEPVECPICHDLCVRGVSSFAIGRSAQPGGMDRSRVLRPALTNHGSGCACCRPRRI